MLLLLKQNLGNHKFKNKGEVGAVETIQLIIKSKAVPLQAWSGPEGSGREVKVPKLHDNGTGWW